VNSESAFVRCVDIDKSYSDGESAVAALTGVSLSAGAGQVTAVVGPSGSGKSTLLHLIGGVERADSGAVHCAGDDLGSMSSAERTEFRASTVSFVFADFNLLPILTAYENVMLGLALLQIPVPEQHHLATSAFERVGLGDQMHRLPRSLSSGERQRVAIARALARKSPIVVADEPTAHLDHGMALEIVSLLGELAGEQGSCVILATHDRTVAEQAHQIVRLQDGRRVE
jgi:ABC-type lipoprotein export system ATPase subunit